MRIRVVPRTGEFFALLELAGANAAETARLAERRFRELPGGAVSHQDVKALEHEGDRILHELVRLLNTRFLAPFDREDVFRLAGAVDDVVDHVDEATEMLDLYAVEAPTPQALDQLRVLVRATETLAGGLGSLRRLSTVERAVVAVKALEDEADRIVRAAVADLFGDPRVDPLVVIRWKDVYEALEAAVDACEQAANVLGNIVVKNR